MTMTRPQRIALRLVYTRKTAELTSGATWADAHTAFINFHTARALEQRGWLTITNYPGEGADCATTPAGDRLCGKWMRAA